MSGMILEEEEPVARPSAGRWIGVGAVALALLLGAGAWAMRRVRGAPVGEPVVAAADSTVRDSVVVSAPASDSVVAEAPIDTAPALVPAPAPAPVPTKRATPDPVSVPAPTPAPVSGEPAYRSTTWVWLRANPVNTAEQLAVVNPNQVVVILERRFGWARVRFDGQEGWMSTEYLERLP